MQRVTQPLLPPQKRYYVWVFNAPTSLTLDETLIERNVLGYNWIRGIIRCKQTLTNTELYAPVGVMLYQGYFVKSHGGYHAEYPVYIGKRMDKEETVWTVDWTVFAEYLRVKVVMPYDPSLMVMLPEGSITIELSVALWAWN